MMDVTNKKKEVRTKVHGRARAEERGYAVFNSGKHLCVDVPDDWFTITAKTSDGSKITFAFCPHPTGKGHQCVDIVCHTGAIAADGIPVQQAAFYGRGTTIARTCPGEEKQTTLVSVNLQRPILEK